MTPSARVHNERKKNMNKNGKKLSTAKLTKIAMLGALATILMLWQVPLPFAPSFYQLDLSELPVIIGAFAMGPIAGIIIELIKILLNFIINGTVTAGVGEISNFLIGCAFIVPSSIIYKRVHSKKGAIHGLGIGIISMVIVGCLLNAFVILPAYVYFMGMDMESIIGMATALNPAVDSLWTFILLAVAPFNAIKGALITSITLLIYKKVRVLLK